ncbi:MAG: hypothetical protein H2075_10440, partial [Pseudomonas sp.]|nr:hypothetical protein [Pseudomonas sp.]
LIEIEIFQRLTHIAQRGAIGCAPGGLDDETLAVMEQAARGTAYGAALSDMRQALEDFDFDQALLVLDRLLLQLQDEETTPS